jgi:hypothetical protein
VEVVARQVNLCEVWKDVSLDLSPESTKPPARDKVEAQASMMKAMNEASRNAFSKMTEEAKILMADLSVVNPLVRAWNEMYREFVIGSARR